MAEHPHQARRLARRAHAATAHRVRRHRDRAVVLRCAARPAAGRRPQVVRRPWRPPRAPCEVTLAAERGRHPRPQRRAAGRLDQGQDGRRRPRHDRRPGTRAGAPALATRLDVDYFKTLTALRGRKEGSRFEYVARRVPSTLASDTARRPRRGRLRGHHPAGRPDPRLPGRRRGRQPARLHGHRRAARAASSAPSTSSWPASTAGHAGSPTPARASGSRCGESTLKAAQNGAPLRTTIDRDLQWFTQKVLAQAVQQYRAESGAAVVMDTRTGEILALADVPTFDANKPTGGRQGRPRLPRHERHLRAGLGGEGAHRASLIDAGKAYPAPEAPGAAEPRRARTG